MSELRSEKLHVRFQDGEAASAFSLPRRYTLTHSDRTGDLFLTIGREYDRKQISGLYTRLMRDEVLAELRQEEKDYCLHVYCHVSGGLVFGTARWRSDILHHHMRSVLQALRASDRELLTSHPELDGGKVLVHFQSSQKRYHRIEDWGYLQDYR